MAQEYDTLLNTYKRMFGMVDAFHFNSQNTQDVFEQYLPIPTASAVVTITHDGVKDHRRLRNFDDKVLKLGFVGSEAPYKGLPMLKRVISRINSDGYDGKIHLNVYGGRTGADEELKNVEYKGRFGVNEMESVYNSIDLLVVPSIWNETFGFTVIEAFQYGVPVLLSNKVGAKDIVKQYASQFVFETEQNLYELLSRLIANRKELKLFNEKIVSSPWQWSMEKHSIDIIKKLYGIVKQDL